MERAGHAGIAGQDFLPRFDELVGPGSRTESMRAPTTSGVYETHGPLGNRDDQGPTTGHDLARLALAGWTLRALVAGPRPTRNGALLAACLGKLAVKLRDPADGRMIRASSA